MSKNVYSIALASSFTVASVQASVVKGTVKFKGTAPSQKEIKMNADPTCKKAHKTPVLSETVVINKNNTVKNVFVYIKDGLTKKYSAPAESVSVKFDQVGCQYIPHVFGIQVGQTLEIINSDPTLHNVHAMPKVQSWTNVGNY